MTGLLMARCRIKIFCGKEILSFGQMRYGIVWKLTGGCGMENEKSHVTDVAAQRTARL